MNKCAFTVILLASSFVASYSQPKDALHVKSTGDFELSGNGSNKAWEITQWIELSVTEGQDTRRTRVKALYSSTGVYFLFDNEDGSITATKTADFERLWQEDVAEVFLWPDTTQTIYFEYEISPLNYELPILVPNLGGKFLGWLPWEYSGDRRTRHMTSVVGGKTWIAEFFIPYKLMMPLNNMPPHPGTVWRANFYRVDYDNKKVIEWSWKKTETNFHQFTKFGKLIFE